MHALGRCQLSVEASASSRERVSTVQVGQPQPRKSLSPVRIPYVQGKRERHWRPVIGVTGDSPASDRFQVLIGGTGDDFDHSGFDQVADRFLQQPGLSRPSGVPVRRWRRLAFPTRARPSTISAAPMSAPGRCGRRRVSRPGGRLRIVDDKAAYCQSP